MTSFSYVAAAQQVIFGAGALAQLAPAVDHFGWRRLLLCTSPSQARNGHVLTLQASLGDRLAAVYDEVSAHVPEEQVTAALALVDGQQIDAVIGLGGGSAIGMAKAVAMALEARLNGLERAQAAFATDQPQVASIAIPTTYAGSEMTPVYGVTHALADGATRKVTVRDGKVTPKLVVYDPKLTLDLPASVSAATGVNALAHCVEALYSISRNPVSSAAAGDGIRRIAHALPACLADGLDLTARTEMLVGAHLAGLSLASVKMGVHHGACHVLGGSAALPHGVANAIMLPHAMRFNLPVAAPQLAQVGAAMGVDLDGLTNEAAAAAAADVVAEWIGGLSLPQRLRDVGVAEDLLPVLASEMLKSSAVQSNPRPLPDQETALQLLRAAW